MPSIVKIFTIPVVTFPTLCHHLHFKISKFHILNAPIKCFITQTMSLLISINCNNDPENYESSVSRTVEKVPLFFTSYKLLSLQISSTDDLLNKEFKFGVLKGSPIARTLELSQTDEHKKLWENINSHRHGLRNSNNDGIRRARWDEKYAFLIEGMLCQISSNKM